MVCYYKKIIYIEIRLEIDFIIQNKEMLQISQKKKNSKIKETMLNC